ncbi:MAG TPA: ABC transporter ATP-binding protein [Pseudonocardiaceae bacterium]|jgi:branched-chain amino acid transport system ATP-binding protein
MAEPVTVPVTDRQDGGHALLTVSGLTAGYGGPDVLHGIDLVVGAGEVVAMLGPNGAGKTTLLRALTGLLRARNGSIILRGKEIAGLSAHRRSAAGLALVPESKGVFPTLSVADNLRVNLPRHRPVDRVLTLFPILRERLGQSAGTLSGGEQQMLGLARALLREPAVLLLDEPSLGLAPMVVDLLFDTLGTIAAGGTTILIAEQNATKALELATRAYLLDRGRVGWHGSAHDALLDTRVADTYLGIADGDGPSVPAE